LLTPLPTVQYGVVAVPGPESEQPAALSTYKLVVAAWARVGIASRPAGTSTVAHSPRLLISLMVSR
jgi:hypothetical protein